MGWLTCDHNYEIFDKTVLESGLEQLIKAGMTKLGQVSTPLLRKKVIILLKCKHCNKIKKIVEASP